MSMVSASFNSVTPLGFFRHKIFYAFGGIVTGFVILL
jgi:hypothetical protein